MTETDETITTTVEVDAELWRQMKADGIRQGNNVREQLEIVLENHCQ